jgi:hypothetical protein
MWAVSTIVSVGYGQLKQQGVQRSTHHAAAADSSDHNWQAPEEGVVMLTG